MKKAQLSLDIFDKLSGNRGYTSVSVKLFNAAVLTIHHDSCIITICYT